MIDTVLIAFIVITLRSLPTAFLTAIMDYVLSRQPLNWQSSQLLLQTPYFFFYKNIE